MKTVSIFCSIVFTIASFLLLLNGCKRQQYSPRSQDLISIALGSAPSSIDPVRATDATGMRLVSLVYQSLVRVGDNLKPTAELAYKWEQSGDKHTFYIKSDRKFSDGSLVRCEDLVSSIEKYKSKTCPFNAAFKGISDVKCKISTKSEDHILSFNTSTDGEKFLLADLPVLKIQHKSLQIGSGAFTIDENKPTHTILKRNPHFQSPLSYDIKFFYLKDDLARFLKVLKGEIDISPNSIPFEKIRAFKNSPMKVLEKPSLSTAYLLINFKNEDLANLEVRKNIYAALNIPELVKYRFDNHVTLARSLLFPEHPYHSPNLETIKHSQTPLKKTNLKLNFKTSNARQTRETGKIIAHKLGAAGIDINLESFEWGTYYKDVKSGRYDLALMKWVGVVDPDLYNIAFHSSEFPPGRNRGYYSNLNLDEILDKGRKVKTTAGRSLLYHQAQEHVFSNLAIIPLWHENQIHVVHPRVSGYKLNPMGDFSSLLKLSIKQQNALN